MENGLKVMLYLAVAAGLFFLLGKLMGGGNADKNSKKEKAIAAVLLIVVIVGFVKIFGIQGYVLPDPSERAQRR